MAGTSKISASTRWCCAAASSSSWSMPGRISIMCLKISAMPFAKSGSISASRSTSRSCRQESRRRDPSLRFRHDPLFGGRWTDDRRIAHLHQADHLGDEPPDVANYAAAHPEFPHEPTTDQWFSESQLESYRLLGLHAIESICGEDGPPKDVPLFFEQVKEDLARAKTGAA